LNSFKYGVLSSGFAKVAGPSAGQFVGSGRDLEIRNSEKVPGKIVVDRRKR
jgi:hypothetical protein